MAGADTPPGATVLRAVRDNGALACVLGAYTSFEVAEFGIWIVLLLYAYDRYGTTGTTAMVLAQLVPAIAFGPYAGHLADRLRPAHVLQAGYLGQAASLGALAAIVALTGPVVLVFVLAAVAALTLDLVRPAQAVVFPAICRTPSELTTANVLSGWADGFAGLAGPGCAGLAVAFGGLVPAIALAAGLNMLAAGLAWAPPARGEVRAVRPSAGPQASGALAGLRKVLADPPTRLLVGFYGFYYTLMGAIDVLCVVLAVGLLHSGQGAAGYLNAAMGAGATGAGAVSVVLAGRRHLARVLAGSLLLAVGALALIGVAPNIASAATALVVVGLAGGVFATVTRVLLQRVAPPDATATSFAAIETAMGVGLACGALVVRAGVAAGGLRAALFAPAVAGVVLVAASWRRLSAVDGAATIPQVEIRLLKTDPIFARLATPVVEGVARRLQAMRVPAGTAVIREGDAGDRYYVIGDGRLVVSQSGHEIRTLERPNGFGEIALVANSRRTSTVTAVEDSLLYALDKESFIEVLTGHPSSAEAARHVVSSYGEPDPGELPGPHGAPTA